MDDERKVDAHGFNWFQRKSKGVSAGDVFSVPLEGGGFGFGRVLNAHDGATLAEFFKYWSAKPEFNEEMRQMARLIKTTEQHVPYLMRKAEQIDAYLGR